MSVDPWYNGNYTICIRTPVARKSKRVPPAPKRRAQEGNKELNVGGVPHVQEGDEAVDLGGFGDLHGEDLFQAEPPESATNPAARPRRVVRMSWMLLLQAWLEWARILTCVMLASAGVAGEL